MGLSYIWFSQINRGIFPSCVHLSNIQVSYWAVSYLIIEHFNVICQHRGLWVKVPPFSTLYFAISDWFSSSSDDKPSWCPTMSFISRARLLRDLKSKIPLIYVFAGVFDKIWVKFRRSFQLYIFIIFTCELPSQLSVSVSRQLRVKSGRHLQYLKIWPLTFHSNINQANHVLYNCAMLNC